MSTETITVEAPPEFAPGSPIRFTGGRYNGFTGTIRLMGDYVAAIIITYNNQPTEVVEELKFCTPLAVPRQ